MSQIGSIIQWYESLDKYPIWVDERATVYGTQGAISGGKA